MARTRINVNTQELVDVLESISDETTFTGLVNAGLVNRLLLTDAERTLCQDALGIAEMVKAQIRARVETLVAGIAVVNEVPDPIADNTIRIDWKTLAAPDGNGFWYLGNSASGNGIDDETRIRDIYRLRSTHNAPQLEFRLAEALNRDLISQVEVYVDNHLEYPRSDTGVRQNTSPPLNLTAAEFANALATTAVHEVAHTLGLVHTGMTQPVSPVLERQFIYVEEAGTSHSHFKLTFDGQTTGLISATAMVADIQLALQGLPNLSPTAVTVADGGGPDAFEVSFGGDLEAINVPALTVLPTLRASVTTLRQGTSAVNEQQRVTLSGGFDEDHFRLAFMGDMSVELPRDATPGQIVQALENLPQIEAGDILVTMEANESFAIEFRGLLGRQDVDELAAVGGPRISIDATDVNNGGYDVDYKHETTVNGASGRADIMNQGTLDVFGDERFQDNLTVPALQMALKLAWTSQDAGRALDYFLDYIINGGFGTWNGVYPFDFGIVSGLTGPQLIVQVDSRTLMHDTLAFGEVLLDGPQGSQQVRTLNLANKGTEPVVVHRVQLVDPSGGFSSDLVPSDTVILPGQELPVRITYDPLVSGSCQATLLLESNDPGAFAGITLTGVGLSPAGDAAVDPPHFVFDALRLHDLPDWQPQRVRILNQGAQPLIVRDIVVGEGNGEFFLGGLPAELEFRSAARARTDGVLQL